MGERGASLLHDVHVVSNRFIFDIDPKYSDNLPKSDFLPYGWGNSNIPQGRLIDFHEPIIHVLNKRSSSFLTSCSFFHSDNETSRTNLILIGRRILIIYC